MDLIGEIIERDVVAPQPPTPVQLNTSKFKRRSRFKDKASPQVLLQIVKSVESVPKVPKELSSADADDLLEEINKENYEKLSKMSLEEIEKERQELIHTLNPKLIESLVKRGRDKEKAKDRHKSEHEHEHAEGYNGWYGGMKTSEGVKDVSDLNDEEIKTIGLDNSDKKKVKFDDVTRVIYEEGTEVNEAEWEDVEDLNDLISTSDGNAEIAEEGYQIIDESEDNKVHFPKPHKHSQEYGSDLDLNDPEFYDKLHEKYYPDLPKETSKLAWMTEPLPHQQDTTYESISDMRFDFQGNLIQLSTEDEAPMYLGLHHHANSPQLPGYTLEELAHLTRSVIPGQRCLSIQMLGRILHKLGLHKYNILPIEEGDNEDFKKQVNDNVMKDFERMMWELIDKLRIIESITEAANEKTTNLSVRNYAIEALWLWKQGGCKPEHDEIGDLMR